MYGRSRSKSNSLLVRSYPEIERERSKSRHGKRKHFLTREFDVLFNKINSIREWTKALIRNSISVVSVETDMNVKEYLIDSEKKHLGRTKLETLGLDMIQAAKGPGIKGSHYERALIKVGECERRLGAYARDLVVDVCSSFIRPMRYFLEVELNKLLEEKEMLTSRKIDYDYHIKQFDHGKSDKNGQHKLKMAETALEFQYMHAKEMLHNIETSDCQIGHLSDFVNAQALYHQKCIAELEKLQNQLQRISSTDYVEKKRRRCQSPLRKASINTGKPPDVTYCGQKQAEKRHSSGAHLHVQACCQNSGENRHSESVNHVNRTNAGRNREIVDAASTKQHTQPNCPKVNDKLSPGESTNARNSTTLISGTNKKHSAVEAPNPSLEVSEVIGPIDNSTVPSRNSKASSQSISSKPTSSGFTPPRGNNQKDDSSDASTTSKETHVIPIPARECYRRDVGKMFFTPRSDLEEQNNIANNHPQ